MGPRRHSINLQYANPDGNWIWICNDLERSPGEKLCEPGILLRLLARTPQDGTGSNDQDATQVTIALFRDWPELLLAAG